VAQEALTEGEERDPLEVRCFATRAQMQVLSVYARDVIGRGRRPEIVVLQAEAHTRRNGRGVSKDGDVMTLIGEAWVRDESGAAQSSAALRFKRCGGSE
jgi:hypothetical protein